MRGRHVWISVVYRLHFLVVIPAPHRDSCAHVIRLSENRRTNQSSPDTRCPVAS